MADGMELDMVVEVDNVETGRRPEHQCPDKIMSRQ